MKIKKKMTENDFNDINVISDTKCCIMMFKIKMNSITDIFMLKVSTDFNFSVNYAFSLFYF